MQRRHFITTAGILTAGTGPFGARAAGAAAPEFAGLDGWLNTATPLSIAGLYTGVGYQAVFIFIAGTWLFGAIVLALFGASTRKARLAEAPTLQPTAPAEG